MTVHNIVAGVGCNPRAVAGTFFIGIGWGAASGVVLAIGSHLIREFFSTSTAASQSLVVSIMLSAFGGIIFGFGSAVGAALALWAFDSRLRRPRFVHAAIAALGALVPAFALLTILGQTATIDSGWFFWLFAYIFASAFSLMVFRSKAHRATSA